MTILIVEDTAILRKILKDILKTTCNINPNQIFEANNALKAINDYKRIKPDVVFMDIGMPKLNGKEAVRELLAVDKNAYIVMCTGSRKLRDVKDCVYAGARDYLVKPLDPQRVKLALKKSLPEYVRPSNEVELIIKEIENESASIASQKPSTPEEKIVTSYDSLFDEVY
jgi:two-component system chemotaxis response regulator CheY